MKVKYIRSLILKPAASWYGSDSTRQFKAVWPSDVSRYVFHHINVPLHVEEESGELHVKFMSYSRALTLTRALYRHQQVRPLGRGHARSLRRGASR